MAPSFPAFAGAPGTAACARTIVAARRGRYDRPQGWPFGSAWRPRHRWPEPRPTNLLPIEKGFPLLSDKWPWLRGIRPQTLRRRAGLAAGGVLAAGLVLAVPQAEAADGEGLFAVKGVGGLRCSEMVGAIEDTRELQQNLAGWLEGYITAHNRLSENTFDATPWQRIELLLDLLVSHCQQNPDVNLFNSVRLMLQALEPTRLERQSEVQEISLPDGGRMELYNATIRQMQQQLIERGHLDAGADGIYGPQTGEALASFQRARGLEVTEVPDQRTLLALFGPLYDDG